MEHSFDVEIAKEYGINCAIILKHIYFWVQKNRANEKHFYDGRYWTYNSQKAFTEQFPYMSRQTVRTTLNKLKDCGLILTGNYNKSAYDKTMWFALADKAISMVENPHVDELKSTARLVEINQPIPDTIPDTISDTKTNNNPTNVGFVPQEPGQDLSKADIDLVMSYWNALSTYGIVPVKYIKPGTKRAISLKARINEYSLDDVCEAIQNIHKSDFLKGKNKKGWVITFDWFLLPNNFPKVLEGNYNRDKGKVEEEPKPKSRWQ